MEITTDIRGDVVRITMADGKKNAITPDAITDLNAALDEAEREAKAVVLAGRPGSFCAGFDLSVMTSGDMDAIRTVAKGGGELAVGCGPSPSPWSPHAPATRSRSAPSGCARATPASATGASSRSA